MTQVVHYCHSKDSELLNCNEATPVHPLLSVKVRIAHRKLRTCKKMNGKIKGNTEITNGRMARNSRGTLISYKKDGVCLSSV